jgi:hypothetical protein
MNTNEMDLDPYKYMEVTHHFIGGIYTKECHLPVGIKFMQHKHTFDHMSVLAQGHAIVEVDGIDKEYHAPAVLNIRAGKHHAITALTPVVWLCQHVTTCTDPDNIDLEITENKPGEQ